MQYKIEFYETNIKKEKPNPDTLKFGKYFTDYMFIMNYSNEKGWYDAQITKYTPLMLDPGTVVFHYAQSVFEGLKAFQTKTGKLNLFRPERNITRFNISNERLNIPTVDEHLLLQSIIKLVNIEKDWIPKKEGSSLYIRPFIIATDIGLGVRSSNTYKLIIILSPVESYFGNQMKPIKIYVENQYVRAAHGGIGFAKTAGNYAASLKAQSKANLLGYDQVLWLDAIEKKYVEEVGSMNIFFKINGEIITPLLNDSILDGVTRDSIIHLLKHWGISVHERRITIQEIYAAYLAGEVEEVFGTGTAAIITPIGELKWEGKQIIINNGEIGELSLKIYNTITGIQIGKEKDAFNWIIEI